MYRIIVKKIDKNKDGYVTEEELKNWVDYTQNKYIWDDTDRQWKDHDKDEDGQMSWSEYMKTTYGFETGKLLIHLCIYMDRHVHRQFVDLFVFAHGQTHRQTFVL
jgi:hypothetical protein